VGQGEGAGLVRLLIFCFALVLPVPALAQMQDADRVPPRPSRPTVKKSVAQSELYLPTVKSVDASGMITSTAGSRFKLWALMPNDPATFEDFMKDRTLYCYAVSGTELDCYIYEKSPHPRAAISALIWLQQFDIAHVDCTATSQIYYAMPFSTPDGFWFTSGFTCNDGMASGGTGLGRTIPGVDFIRP
jgi:hypothetical protein